MDSTMVETWRYLRDHGKPVSEQDAHDYAQIRCFQPPSRKLLKRIKRAQDGKNPGVDQPIREYSQKTPEQVQGDVQRAFHRKVLGQLGGTITIPPAPSYRPEPVQYIHSRNGPIQHKSEREKIIDEGRRLMREHIISMRKMMYSDYQPDMFDVLDAFGSIEHYEREIKNA